MHMDPAGSLVQPDSPFRLPMLKASLDCANDSGAAPGSRGPFQSPAPLDAARPIQQAAHTPFAVAAEQEEPPFISHDTSIFDPMNWSDSMRSAASADSLNPAPFHWVADLDERGISLLDTSFFEFEGNRFDDSFLASDTLDLLTSLSLDSMQLHVYSSPNRQLPAQRTHGHQGLPDEAAERFDTQKMTALEFEALPLADVAVQTTGSRTESAMLDSQDLQ